MKGSRNVRSGCSSVEGRHQMPSCVGLAERERELRYAKRTFTTARMAALLFRKTLTSRSKNQIL